MGKWDRVVIYLSVLVGLSGKYNGLNLNTLQ